MSLFTLVATGVAVGFIFAAPPGAVNTEALRRGLRGGFRAALGVELGAVIGDALYLAVALVGAAAILEAAWARFILGFGGAIGLFYLGLRALKHYRRPPDLDAPYSGTGRGAFATGFLISLANPFALAFWLTVGSGLGAALHHQIGNVASHMAAFFTSFVVGCLIWAFSFSALVAGGRRFITPGLFRWVNLGIGVVLVGFSLWLWYQSIMMFVR